MNEIATKSHEKKQLPYLFELRHLVPRPNFEGVPLFKKSKDQYIIGAAGSDNDSTHKENLDYD